jgi:natural product precursor
VFKNVPKKLSLNKETVRVLSGSEMQRILGGRMDDHGATCTCNCKTLINCPKPGGAYDY